MTLLIAGLALFLGTHLIPSSPILRGALLGRLGEGGYKGLYSLLAVAGLVLIVLGKMRAPFVGVYTPPTWGRPAAMVLVLLAFIAFASAHGGNNIARVLRHPMVTGLGLWAGAHLLANGDQASLVLFGSFALYAVVDFWSASRREGKRDATTQPLRKDLIAIVAGAAVYTVVLFLHPYLFGVAVLH